MKGVFLALLVFCSSCALAQAQSFAHRGRGNSQIIEDATADQVVRFLCSNAWKTT
jgi:hypothetical protein